MASTIGFRDTGLVATDGTYTLTITPPSGLLADDTISFADLFGGGGGGVDSVTAGIGVAVTGTASDPIVSAALTTAQNALVAPVTMTSANTFYVGASVSLAAGTWLVAGRALCTRNATGITQYTMRIGDGTTFYASTQHSHNSQNPHAVSLNSTTIITLGSTTTIRIECAANQAGAVMQSTATFNNGSQANLANMISALRVV